MKPETVIFLAVRALEMGARAEGLQVGARAGELEMGAVSLIQLLKMQQRRESRRREPRVRAMSGLGEVVRAETIGGWWEASSGL